MFANGAASAAFSYAAQWGMQKYGAGGGAGDGQTGMNAGDDFEAEAKEKGADLNWGRKTHNFAGTEETEWVVGEKLIRDKDQFVFLGHGSPSHVTHGRGYFVDAEGLADSIRAAGWKSGQTVLMVSCNTANDYPVYDLEGSTVMKPSIAREVSRILRTTVIAPTSLVKVNSNGVINKSNPSIWKTFKNGQ